MNWVRAITVLLVLWSGTGWAATLRWNPNNEPDLVRYRVYRCDGLPCTLKSGASLLATVEKNETSLNIGTPAEIQYYFVTAVDSANRESDASPMAVFIPVGSPPPPPTPGGLNIVSPK